MIPCGAMGPPLNDHDMHTLGRVPDGKRHYACLTAPAMGDATVPDLAQLAHQWILLRHGLLRSHRWMQYGRPPPTMLKHMGGRLYR